jgi:hypothetical protein
LTANYWIDTLGKDEQLALFKMIDLAIANKKMKDNLQPTPDTLKKKALKPGYLFYAHSFTCTGTRCKRALTGLNSFEHGLALFFNSFKFFNDNYQRSAKTQNYDCQ